MSGFDGSFTSLYAEYREPLFRYVARYTGDPDLADDVVQDTFVRLDERPPPDRHALRGWLFTVATNLARDALKVSRRRLGILQEAADRVPCGTPPPDPVTNLERDEVRERVRVAMATLSEKERTILLLREEGFAHREIAEAVGTTTKSIGTMIARALDKMARRLEPEVE